MNNKSDILFYQTSDGQTKIDVRLEDETVWLNQYQLEILFQTDRTSILKHIRNIYESGELKEESTCAKIAQVQQEGNRKVNRSINYYNPLAARSLKSRTELGISDCGRLVP